MKFELSKWLQNNPGGNIDIRYNDRSNELYVTLGQIVRGVDLEVSVSIKDLDDDMAFLIRAAEFQKKAWEQE